MSSINLEGPTTFTSSVLIGDAGSNAANVSSDSLPVLTEVGGVAVSAALEIQSTLGTLLIPRMTTAQKTALTTVAEGMIVYDTDLDSFNYYQAGAWVSQAPIQYLSGTMTAAEFNGAYGAPHLILAAQGGNTLIKVIDFALELDYNANAYAAGGPASLQYGATVHGAGVLVTTAIAEASFTGAVADTVYDCAKAAVVGTTASTGNTGLYWSNTTAAFTTGDSPINWYLWYSVITLT